MSNYFIVGYQPFHYGGFKLGGVVGAVNGYKGLYNEKSGDYFPMISPCYLTRRIILELIF